MSYIDYSSLKLSLFYRIRISFKMPADYVALLPEISGSRHIVLKTHLSLNLGPIKRPIASFEIVGNRAGIQRSF